MFADSHCHLDLVLDKSDYDINQIVSFAFAKGVQYILSPGTCVESIPKILDTIKSYKNITAAIGSHPNTIYNHNIPILEKLLTLGTDNKIVAIGETGLDYYHAKNIQERENQKQIFKWHIAAAKELHKPLIIHARESEEDLIQILKSELSNKNSKISGVLHCFTGSSYFAQTLIDMGFYISFSGIITFKNAKNLQSIVKEIPLDKMLIETDSPFLSPEPMRGQINTPAYLPHIAEFIAKLLKVPCKNIAQYTTENFLKLYKI